VGGTIGGENANGAVMQLLGAGMRFYVLIDYVQSIDCHFSLLP
jgi:hypothetical protein